MIAKQQRHIFFDSLSMAQSMGIKQQWLIMHICNFNSEIFFNELKQINTF